jgi:uncharacterized glyoxalase superfamily protein PhnB
MTAGDAAIAAIRDALGSGDPSGLGELLAEDVHWYGNFPGGACHNRAQVLATLREQLERGVAVRPETLRSAGDRVLVQVELPTAHESAEPGATIALTLDDAGRIAAIQDYSTPAGAEHDLALRGGGPMEAEPGPASAVDDLVPFVHVADVGRSLDFYRLLGLELRETYEDEGRVVWASLAHGKAALMLAEGEAPIDPTAQGVLFYLYAVEIAALRDHLVSHGLTVGEIVDGSPGPKREMRVTDPDGYCLMIAQIDHGSVRDTAMATIS